MLVNSFCFFSLVLHFVRQNFTITDVFKIFVFGRDQAFGSLRDRLLHFWHAANCFEEKPLTEKI